jgi:hypothetical protein
MQFAFREERVMHRALIDRCTDTTPFRLALLCAALAVVPVLLMGVATTLIGGVVMLGGLPGVQLQLEQAVFALLSLGGALGFVGYLRAHRGARKPDRHNVTATLLCLAAGVVTALAVAGYAVTVLLDGLRSPWGSPVVEVALATLFAAANLVWAVAGIAWMQRLPRCYVERTGRAFDGVPALLLFVALALAIAAATLTTTL